MDRKDLFGLSQGELVNLAERQATIIRNWIRSFKRKSPIKKLFNKESNQEEEEEERKLGLKNGCTETRKDMADRL